MMRMVPRAGRSGTSSGITLWTDGDLWSRINYVHYNPVKHGYDEEPLTYRWSSLQSPECDWTATEAQSQLARFTAPRKVPNDDF